MSPTFLLVPGAGGAGWYWHLVVAELERLGQHAIAADLPAEDERAGLAEYARTIVTAGRDFDDLVLVGQSLGGFSVPMAAEALQPQRIVLLNAMIPNSGETPAEWGDNVGSAAARIKAAEAGGYPTEFTDEVYFFHDVPPQILAEGADHERSETERVFTDRADFTGWAAPVTVLIGRDDRLFPLELQHKVAQDRLGVEPVIIPGGHLAAWSHPGEVAAALLPA